MIPKHFFCCLPALFLFLREAPLSSAFSLTRAPRLHSRASRVSAVGTESGVSKAAETETGGLVGQKGGTSVVFFSASDLRVHDHFALSSAAQNSKELLPVFVADPRDLVLLPRPSLRLLRDALISLRDELRSRGSDLLVLSGSTKDVVREVLKRGGGGVTDVFVHADVTSDARRLQKEAEAALKESAKGASPSLHMWDVSLFPFPLPEKETGAEGEPGLGDDRLMVNLQSSALQIAEFLDPKYEVFNKLQEKQAHGNRQTGPLPAPERLPALPVSAAAVKAAGKEVDLESRGSLVRLVESSEVGKGMSEETARAWKATDGEDATRLFGTPESLFDLQSEGASGKGGVQFGEGWALGLLSRLVEGVPEEVLLENGRETGGYLERLLSAEKETAEMSLGLEESASAWAARCLRKSESDSETVKALSDVLFKGEAAVRLIGQALSFGCVSPRMVRKAVGGEGGNGFLSKISQFLRPASVGGPYLKETVEWREWHRLLAFRDIRESSKQLEKTGGDGIEYSYYRWQGNLVRYCRCPPSNQKAGSPKRPKIVLVHGFGASCEQYSKLMPLLAAEGFEVFALDLLGFGHAEKPRLTYSQYLWEGQIRHFVLSLVGGDAVLAGNSIGGYLSMGAGADLGGASRGVVLLNSAGRVIESGAFEEEERERGCSVETATREYKQRGDSIGPFKPFPERLLRAFGAALFVYLSTSTEKIVKSVYPVFPEEAEGGLVDAILRDAGDPGAIGVIASGRKLPPQRCQNELLRRFPGPVLVCQGVKDPLNDAPARARLLGRAARGDGSSAGVTTVHELLAGHCPHDEAPAAVAAAIVEFVRDVEGGGSGRKAERWIAETLPEETSGSGSVEKKGERESDLVAA
uniref:Photolyase/cryptochrome alpha/beta domain-containing protein n=1 Tax=Chromera velia CCMP2878 TaxID=1169474 RepID=A0A0G4HSB7_9ALVE|eukprot:Cvel_8257.t1-p1 / transcript=Cvel_8257.t1 / gene=Cvel_8257 / organism=Chromera_velia_CCMP2878 / gene_product=none, putative / transcript_product=none, putative / location=Cvel_scaffold452:19750-23309(-) / protein_length=866 / sequence_SO=supercontig / SO=protein_coding / is_pseudo=false